MIKAAFFTASLMLAAISATAGTIANGAWSPGGCGEEPKVPVIDQSSVEAYNRSIQAINDWQQKAAAYDSCLVKEANADVSLISSTANAEQTRLRATIEKVRADAEAARTKLDGK